MGCCLSTLYDPMQPPCDRRSPLIPPQDDVKETVKEVLMETQPMPPQSKSPSFDPTEPVEDQSLHQPKQLESDRDSKPRVPSCPLPPKDWDSQICSQSGRFVPSADYSSSSGALLRTPASKNGEHCSKCSHSPAKRPGAQTQSPTPLATMARRNNRRPQDQSPGCRTSTRVVGGPKVDLGERSGRRSRSPGTRVGRTESGRWTDPSPGRSRRLNHLKGVELIENPPVSLECFIFL